MKLYARKAAVIMVFVLIAAGALAFRVPRLDQRPLHTDEAVHAIKAGELFEQGSYIYDPHDYHGPTIYWFSFPFWCLGGAQRLADTDEWMFRIVPVIFGTGIILLIPLLMPGIGFGAAAIAAIFICVSPAFVFYSRYYIQEMALVLFTLLFLTACWRYLRSGKPAWAVTAGIAAGFMQATKETSVLAWGAMALAAIIVLVWARAKRQKFTPPRRLIPHAILAVAIALIVTATILSNFYRHPPAITAAASTYFSYLDRSHASTPHDHPFFYYLKLLAWPSEKYGPRWTEALILGLAGIGALAAFWGRGIQRERLWFLRFLAAYTVILTLVYSAIPYKTPWCALTFLSGMALLAGVGAMAILRAARYRAVQAALLVVLAAGVFNLGRQAYRGSYTYCADTRNPYVYAHTSTNILRLVKRVNEIAAIAPEGSNVLIKVITPDQWPLPWYLRKFNRVGYWPEIPEDVDAGIVITSEEFQSQVELRMQRDYSSELYGLRPEVLIGTYIQKGLWDRFLSRQINKQQG